MGVEACQAAATGKTLPANVDAPVALVTKDNADQALAATPKPFGQYADPFTGPASNEPLPTATERKHRAARRRQPAAPCRGSALKDLSLLGRMGRARRTRRCWSSSSSALNPTFLTPGQRRVHAGRRRDPHRPDDRPDVRDRHRQASTCRSPSTMTFAAVSFGLAYVHTNQLWLAVVVALLAGRRDRRRQRPDHRRRARSPTSSSPSARCPSRPGWR